MEPARLRGERIEFLDAIRGIAASLVVFEHLLEGIVGGYGSRSTS